VGTGAARPPGRPRSTRADEAITEAVLELLAEGTPVDALSIEAVAARAGVGKATIYRRWPGKQELVFDSLRRIKGSPPPLAGRSVRDDLITLLSAIRRSSDTRVVKIISCLVPEMHRSPESYEAYQQVVEPRREIMREVLRRGVATGELRADLDVEVTLLLLTGPLLVQKMLRWHPGLPDGGLAERVVDAVLAGIAATPRSS
jgi:AcrR family transcriptional regulator